MRKTLDYLHRNPRDVGDVADDIGGALLALGSLGHGGSVLQNRVDWEQQMIRLRHLAYGLALVLGTSVTQSTVAAAATIDLFCHEGGATGAWGLNVSIDTTASTAVAWTTDSSRGAVPASPATITDDKVTWGPLVVNAPEYALDRNSGALTQYSTNQMGGSLAAETDWNCKKATPVF